MTLLLEAGVPHCPLFTSTRIGGRVAYWPMAATDWAIDGTLLDATGNTLDLSNATLTWTLIGPQGTPVLQNSDASITVVGDPTAGTIHIAVHNAKTKSEGLETV